MRVAIFCSPADAAESLSLLNAFRDLRIDAFALKVRKDWENLRISELQGYVEQISHYLVIWSAASRDETWLPFVVGHSLGRGFHTALYRINPDFRVATYLSSLPVIDTVEELSTFYIVEQSLYLSEREKSNARRELFDMGLSFTVEGMAGCVKDGNLKAVDLFIQTGISADARDRHGVPLLCLAARYKHRRVLELLLERGASVDSQSDDRGNSALMDAVACGAAEIVGDLLAAKACPDLQSKDGQTALIIAIGRHDALITGILLSAGADPDIQDKLGFSARKYAALFHKAEITILFDKLAPADSA